MILTVSLNPAVDKYIRLRRLARGQHQQAEQVVTSAGGKAVNVAGVLRELGEEVELIGFFGGFTGQYLVREIAAEGVRCRAIEIATLSRTAFVLVEEDGAETEMVEPGGAVTAGEIAALRQAVRAAAARAQVIVLSGSAPPGCPDDIYLQLLADCAGRCPVIVDTSLAWLQAVVDDTSGAARPAMIKPNRREAEAALGTTLASPAAMAAALRHLAARGIPMPIISDGAHGLHAWMDGAVWQARPPLLQRVNSVGSGDAAVAGFAAALARGAAAEAMLRLAAACGAANVLTQECALVHRADVERLLPQITVERH
ncbi:MAG TPA: hexose kinase [Terriglobales bacterium]|nr:hexose kinase [Terriglobales bacterium]